MVVLSQITEMSKWIFIIDIFLRIPSLHTYTELLCAYVVIIRIYTIDMVLLKQLYY